MVDVKIFHETCPRCDGDVEEVDSYDDPSGVPVAEYRCLRCGFGFMIERLWVIREEECDSGGQSFPGKNREGGSSQAAKADNVKVVNVKAGAAEKEHAHREGNFIIGAFWGDVTCVHGHPVRFMNIHRCHYVVCDECKTYLCVGENLTSCWRRETLEIWAENIDSLKGMTPANKV